MNNKVVRLIILIFATGVTRAREWPDSLAMENSPYISHVKPPQSYPSPWFVQQGPSNAKYLGRETQVSSRLVDLTDGRNQETNPSLTENVYYVSDLNHKKPVQGSAAPAGRHQWRAATPVYPRNYYFPQTFKNQPIYFGQGQRRLAE